MVLCSFKCVSNSGQKKSTISFFYCFVVAVVFIWFCYAFVSEQFSQLVKREKIYEFTISNLITFEHRTAKNGIKTKYFFELILDLVLIYHFIHIQIHIRLHTQHQHSQLHTHTNNNKNEENDIINIKTQKLTITEYYFCECMWYIGIAAENVKYFIRRNVFCHSFYNNTA